MVVVGSLAGDCAQVRKAVTEMKFDLNFGAETEKNGANILLTKS